MLTSAEGSSAHFHSSYTEAPRYRTDSGRAILSLLEDLLQIHQTTPDSSTHPYPKVQRLRYPWHDIDSAGSTPLITYPLDDLDSVPGPPLITYSLDDIDPADSPSLIITPESAIDDTDSGRSPPLITAKLVFDDIDSPHTRAEFVSADSHSAYGSPLFMKVESALG